uniref:Uncharacterized protein n=1 Tax=Parascaris equorum TaxID=6256 RepID=A0A914S6M1_PAREQ
MSNAFIGVLHWAASFGSDDIVRFVLYIDWEIV